MQLQPLPQVIGVDKNNLYKVQTEYDFLQIMLFFVII